MQIICVVFLAVGEKVWNCAEDRVDWDALKEKDETRERRGEDVNYEVDWCALQIYLEMVVDVDGGIVEKFEHEMDGHFLIDRRQA